MQYRYIFYLYHVRFLEYDKEGVEITDRKDLGIFSSRKNAFDAIIFFNHLPGFSLYPNNYHIERKRLNLERNAQDLPYKIYELYHEYEDKENDCDIITRLGLFPTYEIAENKIIKLKDVFPYSLHPDNFQIGEWILNEKSLLWDEGFYIDS